MKTAMIIASREVREKARLFVICAGFSLMPFAATLLPGTRGQSADVLAVVGGFLAAILGFGIAVALGGSTIVRDLAERRMSFYFTKPVSAAAIWIGKAAAGLFVSIACFLIIVLPSALVARRAWATQWLGSVEPLAVAALAIVVLFFLSHTMSTIIRSRSPLIALDFVFAVVAVAAVYLIARPLIAGMAIDLAWMVGAAIGVAILILLMLAPAWQLANGRSDIRRSHVALMRFLWPSIAVVLMVAGSVVTWMIRVSPHHLVDIHVSQAPRGPSVIVSGRSPRATDYHATFAIDRTTSAFIRIGSSPWRGAQYSDDGRVLMWLQPVGTFRSPERAAQRRQDVSRRVRLEVHTLKGATGLVISPSSSIVLSGDGARVAITDGGLLAVHELATGKLLASAAGLSSRARHQLFFVTPDLVRVYEVELREGPTPLRIFELDVRARATRKTGERMLSAPAPVSVSRDGSRMFDRSAKVIADARTGETIATIDAPNHARSEMLYDGRVAMTFRDARNVPHLRTFSRDGKPLHEVAFPKVFRIGIAGEMENGKLIVSGRWNTSFVVDLASGAVERTLTGIAGPSYRWSDDPRLIRYAADQEFVGIDAKGKLVVWKNEGRASARPLLPSR